MARILVADDEEMVRHTLCGLFEFAGHETIEASDGEEAIQHYREALPDLVITDIKMPKKDGLEVIQDLKADFPNVKIIAITGYEPDSLHLAEKLGASYTLTKPYRTGELMDIVNKLLEEAP
jgi:CheY-like chemotaxis protein